jgi:hypothetical protein
VAYGQGRCARHHTAVRPVHHRHTGACASIPRGSVTSSCPASPQPASGAAALRRRWLSAAWLAHHVKDAIVLKDGVRIVYTTRPCGAAITWLHRALRAATASGDGLPTGRLRAPGRWRQCMQDREGMQTRRAITMMWYCGWWRWIPSIGWHSSAAVWAWAAPSSSSSSPSTIICLVNRHRHRRHSARGNVRPRKCVSTDYLVPLQIPALQGRGR